MQFYGWYQWTRGPVAHARSLSAVQRFGPRGWIWTSGGTVTSTAILGTVMHRYTDAALPYPDAFTTTLSVIAQFLLTKKYLENWTLWIAVDVVYVGMLIFKGLNLTAFNYAVYLGLAVMGHVTWRRSLRLTQAASAAAGAAA
jgi:nicotinamide mononucleotide transporter